MKQSSKVGARAGAGAGAIGWMHRHNMVGAAGNSGIGQARPMRWHWSTHPVSPFEPVPAL